MAYQSKVHEYVDHFVTLMHRRLDVPPINEDEEDESLEFLDSLWHEMTEEEQEKASFAISDLNKRSPHTKWGIIKVRLDT